MKKLALLSTFLGMLFLGNVQCAYYDHSIFEQEPNPYDHRTNEQTKTLNDVESTLNKIFSFIPNATDITQNENTLKTLLNELVEKHSKFIIDCSPRLMYVYCNDAIQKFVQSKIISVLNGHVFDVSEWFETMRQNVATVMLDREQKFFYKRDWHTEWQSVKS